MRYFKYHIYILYEILKLMGWFDGKKDSRSTCHVKILLKSLILKLTPLGTIK